MSTPIVSVLIPVYNVEKYLEKCLDSVLGQSLTDIEIICVDDGSTDGSPEILKKYQDSDKRVKVVTKENGGLPSARNAGLDLARGKYVGFVDSDDYIERDMYKKLVHAAERNNSDVVICGANIFPEEPRAAEWLYTCLSPYAQHYKEFDPKILFERPDATPFLWRILVRRELLEEHGFRLDEDIIVGEDKAFQCKIYPYANGITVIPDKLYNYYWCRPDSLMGKQVYGKMEKKVLEHTRLVERIAEDLSLQEDEEKDVVAEEFLNWSLSFIYDDFIYLSKEYKLEAAERVLPVWKNTGYYRYSNSLPLWKREMFQYIESFFSKDEMRQKKRNAQELSVIVPIEYGSRYVEELTCQLEELLAENVEVIFINNGMKMEDYTKVQKFLYQNPQVRLNNTPKHLSYAEALNVGIQLAAGEYLLFLDPQDRLVSSEKLQAWLKRAIDTSAELCVSDCIRRKMPIDADDWVQHGNDKRKSIYEREYHSCLYQKSFLEKKEILFEEASRLTGYLFFCQAVLNAKKITAYQDYVYVLREIHMPDWISTEKCEQVLEGLKKLAELSVEYKDASLHGKVYSLLNSDIIKQIIVNNTKPYVMPPQECPEGENSQIKTVETIIEILELADIQMLEEYGYQESDCIFETLYEVIRTRQEFLNEFSKGHQVIPRRGKFVRRLRNKGVR